MKPVLILVLAAFLPVQSFAKPAAAAEAETHAPDSGAGAEAETAAETATGNLAGRIFTAAEVDLDAFLWLYRPIVVFADSPADPLFERQMRLLAADRGGLVERDVVIITDTDPAARSAVRLRLRPRGFGLVLMDKDGDVKLRKPLPWDLREIAHAIDKFPLRRQEMLEQRPAGR